MRNNIFKWAAFVFILFSLSAMILPNAYVMKWMSPPDSNEIWTNSYSYFSFTPYGYANFFPFLTVIIAVFAAVFFLINNISSKLKTTAFVLICISTVFSLLSLLMSYSVTLAGIMIFIFMMLSIIFQCFFLRKK